MKSLLEPQKQKQINFLKELSYEEINDMLRHYKVKLENLKAENEQLKEAAQKVFDAWINWDEGGSRQMQEAIDEMEEHLT